MTPRFTAKRLLLVAICSAPQFALTSLRLTAWAQVPNPPNPPALVPTEPSLDPSLAPSTDPCGYPSPPSFINCGTTPSGTPESVPAVPLPSPAPCTATASLPTIGDINAEKALASQFVSVQPLSDIEGPQPTFSITSEEAKTAALADFPGSLVCAEFPAEMSDAMSSAPAPSPVWVLSLSPAEPILSHPAHNVPPAAATYLYIFVDGQTGEVLQGTAGGPNPGSGNLPVATPTP